MEEVPEVIAEQSVPDKVIDDFILEESVNVPDSVIAQPKQCIPPPIHEVYSQLNLSEVRDPGLCNQNGLTLTPQIEEVVLLPDQGGSLEDREMDAFLDEEQKGLLREGDSREKNLDSEPLIADISDIDSQDSVIPLNEKDGQDVYLASPSSESCVASPGFEYTESNKSGLKKSPDVGKSTPPTSQTSKTNQTN
ncbi:3754_t:CDS:2, partial [Rhizophagus irregularis]